MTESSRTSKQLIDAPLNAVFIWPTNNIRYPVELAKHLGREDIQIERKSWLGGYTFYGLMLTGIILDHSIRLIDLSLRERDGLNVARYRVMRTNAKRNLL
jgi:hypothetical protein